MEIIGYFPVLPWNRSIHYLPAFVQLQSPGPHLLTAQHLVARKYQLESVRVIKQRRWWLPD